MMMLPILGAALYVFFKYFPPLFLCVAIVTTRTSHQVESGRVCV